MIRYERFGWWATALAVILFCGLNSQRTYAASTFVEHNLVSDIPFLADFTDPNLVNPWGISFTATSPFWVCDNGTGLSTVYTASATVQAGTVSTTVVTVPATSSKAAGGRCSGQVANTNTAAFAVNGTAVTFIFATEDGSISARVGSVGIIKVDNSGSGAVYKGLALFTSTTANYLYAANFHSGKIDVFDGNYAPATLPGTFTDPAVPAGFAPFNIQNLSGKLFVTYAKQDADKEDDVSGLGNGFVSVFDTNGNLLQHLISGAPLNSPWGVQIAPSTFGDFAGALLVGNFGDGAINAFNTATGALLGTLKYPSGNSVSFPGIWGLQFGNGGSGGDPNVLYFAAGINFNGSGIEGHGLIGAITVATGTAMPIPVVSNGGVVNAASYSGVSAGMIVDIFGSNLTDGTSCIPPSCFPSFDNTGRARTIMSGAQVSVNGLPTPILGATPGQLAIVVPSELTGTTASLQVAVAGQSSAGTTLNLTPAAPGLFSLNTQGTGPGAITHNNGNVISAANPALPGESIVIYGTGLGQVTPAVPTGTLPKAADPTVTTATATIDGLPATVQYSGLSGCCTGLDQINVVVPSNVHTNTNVNVVVSIGTSQSNTVTIATGAAATPAPPVPPAVPVTVSSLSLSATSMTAGSSYQGAVVLSGSASSATSVTLASSNPLLVSVPPSVTVPAGATSGTFTITTSFSVTVSTAVTITASAGGVAQMSVLTVMPAPPPPPDPYGY